MCGPTLCQCGRARQPSHSAADATTLACLLCGCPPPHYLQVHDIEDLAKIGKRHTACPYFVARHLADSADLVFCPYSYLLDPNIRRSTRVRGRLTGSEGRGARQGSIEQSLQLHRGFAGTRLSASILEDDGP